MRTFDKEFARKFREMINENLKELAEEHGVTINAGSCSFSETEMKFRLEVKTTDKEVLAMKEKTTWDNNCKWSGFEQTDFGATFEVRGEKYQIVGLDIGRSKFDLKGKKLSNGKVYLFQSSQIAKKLHPDATEKINQALPNP